MATKKKSIFQPEANKGGTEVNLGGERMEFIYAFEKYSQVHAWVTVVSEEWCLLAAEGLYRAITEHPIICINSNITNHKDFAATMRMDLFKGINMSGKCEQFKDVVFALYDELMKNNVSPFPKRMFTNFCSTTSDHQVNCMLEIDKGLIMFGANVK